VRGRPAILGEYPSATMAEEMDTPGEGRIRALVTIAGNPVLSAPNGRRVEAALPNLDFQLAIDPYINETTRYANLILPPVSPLERSHYDLVFHSLAIRNSAKFNDAVFEPPADARHDWQILHGLETRLGARRRDGAAARMERWVRGRLGPDRLVDLGLRLGSRKLSVAKLRRTPSGVDLGPLEPTLPGRLPKNHAWIDAAPELLVADMARLDETFSGASESSALRLIGRRNPRDCNSWMHNAPLLMRGRDRCTLMMHPADAERIGVVAGGSVRIRSRVGEVVAPVQITRDVMQGVVSLPHGYGHGREGTVQSVADAHPGVSINDLTDDLAIDELSGNAAFTGVPVQVQAMISAESKERLSNTG
jgi:anaerobic selenocysteine-containing dehydrogenase